MKLQWSKATCSNQLCCVLENYKQHKKYQRIIRIISKYMHRVPANRWYCLDWKNWQRLSMQWGPNLTSQYYSDMIVRGVSGGPSLVSHNVERSLGQKCLRQRNKNTYGIMDHMIIIFMMVWKYFETMINKCSMSQCLCQKFVHIHKS